MTEIGARGLESCLDEAFEIALDDCDAVFLSVDIDVCDPGHAPGTGTPEPGGMTSIDLLRACRELAARLELVGADVVEVIPTGVGSTDITALVAERIVREILTGIALGRTRA
jgi:agmatinase